ncbi:virulence RhuM family protein [Ruminiclostridium cellobioparum]|uniref:virulence RhuM family protein n=1 Tax=Ruminiclostridium cellobioparum TaxID=29355 RepID=UPI0028B0ED1A|nr:virulence RhuM family protein [Ruminiclostridium cellobioparum]
MILLEITEGDNELEHEDKIILYTTDSGKVTVSVRFEDDNFWMTQKAIADLFEIERSVITKHLSNIYEEEELDKNSTCAKFAQVQIEGSREVSRLVDFYNLDAIIAVGYRVNSKKATRFRQWATKTLHEYIQKGFILNDELLKNGHPFCKDYFDELLERIREIRASERRAYQKIADVFEQCSFDYDKNSSLTREFYAFVQNKLHYAITGKTAAELIAERVDPEHPSMGLTIWKAAPGGKIIKQDVVIAKNYLNEKELSRMNRIVTMFIDYAELMAEDEIPMSMADWLRETDNFLQNNRRRVLEGKGKVSHEDAVKKAGEIYEQFRVRQDREYISQFDKEMSKYLKGESDKNE